MKYKIDISYSRDSLDSWEEGRKIGFTIESPTPIMRPAFSDIAHAYLKATGVSFREYMYRVTDLENETKSFSGGRLNSR